MIKKLWQKIFGGKDTPYTGTIKIYCDETPYIPYRRENNPTILIKHCTNCKEYMKNVPFNGTLCLCSYEWKEDQW